MATISQVKEAFDEQKIAIESLIAEIAARYNEIQDRVFDAGRELDQAESAEISALETAREKLGEALQDLALDTLENLNRASDVQVLIAKIQAIAEGLKQDLDHLRRIERFAEAAAAVAAAITGAADKLVRLKLALPI